VDVILHEAIAQKGNVVLLSMALQKLQIKSLIFIAKKYSLAATPALNDMMRTLGHHDPGDSRHSSETFLEP
jgi:hypothetical protein